MDTSLLVRTLNMYTFRFDMLLRYHAVQLLVTATYPFPLILSKFNFDKKNPNIDRKLAEVCDRINHIKSYKHFFNIDS